MPDFTESLQGKDLGHLRIIAYLWGIALEDQEIQQAILSLKKSLLTGPIVNNMISQLTAEERAVLEVLCQNSGRMAWAQFTRRFGEIREMGPAKRDRERPFDTPISKVEALWYRGLVARAFFDSSSGPEEFAYVPEDLLALLPQSNYADGKTMGRSSSVVEYARIFPSNDRIVDHACTYLAGRRAGIDIPYEFATPIGEALTRECMQVILLAGGLVDEAGNPFSEPVRVFLEARRGEAIAQLFNAWRTSSQVNELRLLPDFVMEGKWENDPLRARLAILGFLSRIPPDTWWSLDSFISAIKQHSPDFQRPAGDYDSWFIKDNESGAYLRGFEHWDKVEGRLVRYLVSGPLYWLGVVDLACPEDIQEVKAFRLSGWSKALLNGEVPKGFRLEEEKLAVRSDARIGVRRLSPRSVRYQLARFCEWEKETADEYLYRISTASLERAQQQGLKVSQLVTILNHHAKAMPPSLIRALERWDKHGSEAKLERMVVLRVASEEILQALRKSRVSRFLGEPLGPATIAIKPGAIEKVLAGLAELGYLGEIRGDAD